jgi:hypothetical protein
MKAQHHSKAKITIDCTVNERVYIKILAARAHMNLSEFFLSYIRKDFPQEKVNKTTLKAMEESKKGKNIKCDSIEDFWGNMGMNPNA